MLSNYLWGIPWFFAVGMSWAGNAQMMQQNAQTLIQLNEEVVKQVGGVPSEGRVLLEARVKSGTDGQKTIYIDQVSTTASVPSAARPPSILAPTANYRTFIHTEDLPIPVVSSVIKPEATRVAAPTTIQDFTQLLSQQPQARIRELTGAAIESLADKSTLVHRGFFIYW